MLDPQDRGDGVDRDRDAELAHQVEGLCARDGVQGLVNDALDLRAGLGHAGVEGLGQGAADAGMIRIVQHQDAGGLPARDAFDRFVSEAALHHRRRLGPHGVAPQGAVGDQGADVIVAGQDKAAGHLVPAHRAAGAQVVENLMRIGSVGRIQRRQLEDGRQRLVGHPKGLPRGPAAVARASSAGFGNQTAKTFARQAGCGPCQVGDHHWVKAVTSGRTRSSGASPAVPR